MKKSIICAILALQAATFACSIFVGGPSYPDTAGTPAATSAQTLQDQVEQSLVQGAQSGMITVQLTEDQLTSYVTAQLAQQTNPLLTEPKVFLRDGQIEVYGKARSGIFTANVSIFVQASVDQDGQPQLQITKTDFGPLAAPQGLNEALAAFMREALTGWLGPVATGFRMESISISDGVMTVTGRIK